VISGLEAFAPGHCSRLFPSPWEDAEGTVWLSYNSPEYLKQRHNIPDELLRNIAGVGAVLAKAVE